MTTDYPNLRGNFSHILSTASLRDIHVMLCVLSDHLQELWPPCARHVALAADLLSDRVTYLARPGRLAEHLSPLPPHEGAGGERSKS